MSGVAGSGAGKRRRQARAELHGERPVVQVGKGGLTDAVMASVEEALAARERIKIRVGRSCPIELDALARALADALRAEVVGIVGRHVMLARPRPGEKPRAGRSGATPDSVTGATRSPPSRPARGS